MYHIKIFYPGKTKTKFIKEGCDHYIKLLKAYTKLELLEVKQGHGDRQKVIEEESKAILNAVKGNFILLHKDGKMFDSIEFAEFLQTHSTHQFVIGGVYGVNESVLEASSFKISLSRLTFTHELTRLILLEQIYRAMTIIHGKSYHY